MQPQLGHTSIPSTLSPSIVALRLRDLTFIKGSGLVMSERAAAAEARRLKILARGRDRLSAITVGSIAGMGSSHAAADANPCAPCLIIHMHACRRCRRREQQQPPCSMSADCPVGSGGRSGGGGAPSPHPGACSADDASSGCGGRARKGGSGNAPVNPPAILSSPINRHPIDHSSVHPPFRSTEATGRRIHPLSREFSWPGP